MLNSNGTIIIFGTKAMGMIGKKVLDYYCIRPVCFCDNDVRKQGTYIEDIKVLSSQEAIKTYSQATVYVCTFSDENYKVIKKQLIDIGFKKIKNNDELLYIYQTKIMKRPVQLEQLTKGFEEMNDNSKMIIKSLGVPITTKCTLRCKDCGALIAHAPNLTHQKKEIIIESVRKISEIVDVIGEVRIFGGEPLLHPDLVEICKEISKIGNIKQIFIITNGTLTLSDEKLEELRHYITYISISNYGDLSRNIEALISMGRNHGMYVEADNGVNQWIDFGGFSLRERNDRENMEIFHGCSQVDRCNSVIDGRYYLCGRSAFGDSFSLISAKKEDYLQILDSNDSIEVLRMKLIALKKDKMFLEACKYCDWIEQNGIQPAIQQKG